MLLTEYETKCEGCGKKMKLFSGFENWSVQENCRILSLCEKCSKKVKNYIKKLN